MHVARSAARGAEAAAANGSADTAGPVAQPQLPQALLGAPFFDDSESDDDGPDEATDSHSDPQPGESGSGEHTDFHAAVADDDDDDQTNSEAELTAADGL
jgi:hypothetical protein